MSGETTELTRSLEFEWGRRVPSDPRKQADLLVAAAQALGSLLSPWRFELSLDRRDSDELPPRWSWTVEEEGAAEAARPGGAAENEDATDDADDEDVVVRRVPTVDAAGMTALVRDAFAGADATIELMNATVDARWRRAPGRNVRITLWSLQRPALEIDWPEMHEAAAHAEIERAADLLERIGWRIEADTALVDDDDEPPAALSRTAGADGAILADPLAIGLVWRGADREDPAARAGVVFDAAAALAVVGEPSAATLLLTFSRTRGGLPRRFMVRFLVAGAGPVPEVEGCVSAELVDLGVETLRAAVQGALGPQRPGGLLGRLRSARPVTWLSIDLDLRARLPDQARGRGRDSLVLDSTRGAVRVELEARPDGVHTAGVTAQEVDIATAPVALTFSNGPDLELEIELRWSMWADPSAAGRELVEQAVARLCQSGWKRAIRAD